MNKKNKDESFLSGLLKFAIGPLGGALIGFLTVPITTWLVSPEEFGKSTMFMLVQTLTTSFLYLGMDHAYAREYNEYQDKHKVLFNALALPLVLACIISLSSLIFADSVAKLIFETDLNIIVYIYALWVPFVAIENLLLLNIRMKEKGLAFSAFNIFLRLNIMILTIAFLTAWSKSYVSIVLATVLGQIVVDIILIIYSRKELVFKRSYFDKELTKRMLKFGLPWIPATIIGWVLTASDRIFLERYTNYEQVGIYFAAMKIIGVLGIIQSIFISYWSPVSYRWQKEGVENEKFTIVSQSLMFLMALLFLGVLLFKDLFIAILSPEYSKAAIIVPFLLFYPIMNTVSNTTALGIPFSRKTHYNIWISTVAAISNVILNILLVPKIGTVGAAIATGVSYIIFFWIRTLISRKLWYNFDLKYYFVTILILLIGATANVMFDNLWIYLINIILIFMILIYNYKLIQLGLSYIRKFKYNRGKVKI
ncbi:oligosaccharide flippase family protein [Bacillus cereus]|uniref:oligosaccharide flippase family protein n=1 Tax=Bacillus cereus TaxID=1396 RepID=UPI0018F70830|nr:oligosaccharide flippase family protein [Bacillus cereus]MBJ7984633.1 oligosaccharide flippase family protein [Bacillus cereus]